MGVKPPTPSRGLQRPASVCAALALVMSVSAAQSLGPPPAPPENPITEEKRILGKTLFWDEQLSSDNSIACGTCHIPSTGGSDPRLGMDNRNPGPDGVFGTDDDRFASKGVHLTDLAGDVLPTNHFGFEPQVTDRHAPTMIGSAFFDELFWDGRAGSKFIDPETGATSVFTGGALETQALGPILSIVEMGDEGRTWTDVREKLERVAPLALATDLNPDLVAALSLYPDYPALFQNAFGDPAINAERIAFALATYQRTLHPDQTPYDLFEQGQTNALTAQERSGRTSFFSTGNRCTECHVPPLFSDGSYRNIGLRPIAEDNGRQAITGDFSDRGKFKVPTLRNVGLRDRFFHNGEPNFNSMFLAVFFYNQGAGLFLDNKDPLLNQIVLSPSVANNIAAFLGNGLTDPRVVAELPPFDRPTLASERGPVTMPIGSGVAGSGGIEPKLTGAAPAYPGANEFRLVMYDALGGAPAALGATRRAPGMMPGGGPLPAFSLVSSLLGQRILEGSGPGRGYTTFRWTFPPLPALTGSKLYFRGLVRDPGGVNGRALTSWVEVTVQ